SLNQVDTPYLPRPDSTFSPRWRKISRSRIMVFVRAKLRLTSRIRMGFSSWPVAIWKRRRNSSSFRSTSFLSNSSFVKSRNSLTFLTGLTTCFLLIEKSCPHRQLMARQTHRLACLVFRDSRQLKKNSTWFYNRHPAVRSTLPAAHPCFRRFGCHS